MNGQTLVTDRVRLPAAGKAVYTSGPTLSFYRHADWLERAGELPAQNSASHP